MKIKVTKDCEWSFSPSKPIEVFKKDEVYNLTNDKAEKLIKGNYAKETETIKVDAEVTIAGEKVETKPEEIEIEEPETEEEETEEKAQPPGENKMLNSENKEDKARGAKKGKKKGK